MQISAEIRWFWERECPELVNTWFHTTGLPPSGGIPRSHRLDHYLHLRGNPELGIKIRDEMQGKPKDIEVKGLICIAGLHDSALDIDRAQVWCKWKAHESFKFVGVRTEKTRWLRKFHVDSGRPLEIALGPDERPLTARGLPGVGCNVELTKVTLPGRGEVWWTLCFEAFGDLQSAPDALAQVIVELRPYPKFDGLFLSYPAWLDRLEQQSSHT